MRDRRTSKLSLALFALAAVIAVLIITIGLIQWRSSGELSTLTLGLLSLVVLLAAKAISREVAIRLSRSNDAIEIQTSILAERLEQFSIMLNLISEQQKISERAKAIAFRDEEHETILRAVREEAARGEFDAALMLVNDIENTLGYKQEAEQLRIEIAQKHDVALRKMLNEAIGQIDRQCVAEKWDEAFAAAESLAQRFPQHELTALLPSQVRARKESVKQMLLQKWRDAVAKKDIDASVDALRSLDFYLTPDEVAELKDGALEIFKARIESLRKLFKLHVHERRWKKAIAVGEMITEEFPTSKIAQEVRDAIQELQQRMENNPDTPLPASLERL